MTVIERLQMSKGNTENRETVHLPKPGDRAEEKGQESVLNCCVSLTE